MVLPLWRSLHSLNLMLPKEDRKAMLLRLYGEDTPLQDHSKERFNQQPEKLEAETKDSDIGMKIEEGVDEDWAIKGEGDQGALVAAGLGKDEIDDEVREDEDVKHEHAA